MKHSRRPQILARCQRVLIARPLSDRPASELMEKQRPQSTLCQQNSFCKLLSRFSSTRSWDLESLFQRSALLNRDAADIRAHGLSLGTYAEIVSRKDCPFCRLAAATIWESPQGLGWTGMQQIAVFWDSTKEALDLVCNQPEGSNVSRSLPLGERIRQCQTSTSNSSRIARSVDPDHIHPNVVKNWISLCDEHHLESSVLSNPGIIALRESSDQLLLIDAHHHRIVQKPWKVRYIALSYVWGRSRQLTLSKDNFGELSSPSGLQAYRDQIPKTIWDTIYFVKMIGMRYLWVDSLCLIQDDVKHLSRGVQLMGLIYDGAYLTIIAANGSHADTGLPRIYERSRVKSQKREQIAPGLNLAIVRAVDCYLRQSTWASRGWTYQEEVFSRRSIIFTNEQVYFRCRQRIWAEDTWADSYPQDHDLDEWNASWVTIVQDVDFNLLLHPLERLLNLVEGFQLRTLTRDSDAINAVSGILQPLSKQMKTSLLEGLPTCAFDLSLLFSHLQASTVISPGRRRRDFPSWSWAGWVGRTHWNAFHELYSMQNVAGINSWLDQRTWIRWYKFTNGQFAKIVRYTEPVGSSERGNRDIMYERRSPLPPALERFPGLKTSQTEPTRCFINKIPYPLLAFFTVCVTMTVQSWVPAKFTRPQQPHLFDALFDRDHSFCGLLSPDMRHGIIEHKRLELILLSEADASCFPPLAPIGLQDEIHRVWLAQSHDGVEADVPWSLRWQLFWVLAVSWEGECYERRGLGQILQSSVDKSLKPGPQWKEIILG